MSPRRIVTALGTDPEIFDPDSARNPVLMVNGSGSPEFTFGRGANALPGTIWRVTRSPDLTPGSFVEIFRFNGTSTIPAAPDANVHFTISTDFISVIDLTPHLDRAFYRFEAIAP